MRERQCTPVVRGEEFGFDGPENKEAPNSDQLRCFEKARLELNFQGIR